MPRQESWWYKDAVIYEVPVRAYSDSVGDGMGDFRGLAQKLDYLEDLGVTAVWLLPFYPSPLRDDGYDIADYTGIHRDFGTLEAFQEFLQAAHARGLRVITELVLNHTSDQHPWFQRARRAPAGSPERDFYVWSDTPERYQQARVIFRDFEASNWSWDPLAQAYYWHRFYSHQPDLNFDNPAVWQALFAVVDFWFGQGVDGMRLDAVPYLYERDGTNCENLAETHDFLRALRKHVDERFPGRMLLAEANQWPEDSVAYFGQGDECQMAFHFPVMPRLFMAMHMEDRLPIIDIMEQTPALPESCQWAMFLRNHDELTLEMVTDEERDYMYEAYAGDPQARINLGIRRRLAPLLGGNRRRIELMNGLLFSLPGTPVLYYGDEIGMGDNIYLGDRNGVRTPMQWSADRNAGFSRANPQRLYLPIIIDPEYHYEAINVETQQNNLSSLLWWTKRLIGLRRMHRAFSRGTLEFLRPLNRHVLAFLRSTDEETLLVVANLSRFVQSAELDLSAHAGAVPVELFGSNRFPTVGSQPYPMMLGPHAFYWFSLTKSAMHAAVKPIPAKELPTVQISGHWDRLASDPALDHLERLLADYLRTTALRSRPVEGLRRVQVQEVVPVETAGSRYWLLVLDQELSGTSNERTWLPLALVPAERIAQPPIEGSWLIARVEGSQTGWIADARALPEFQQALWKLIETQQRIPATSGAALAGVRSQRFSPAGDSNCPPFQQLTVGGSTVAAVLGNEYLLTEFSRVEVVPHPEQELGRWLSETREFPHAPRWLGTLEYRRGRFESSTLATLHAYISNEGTAWQFTLDELSAFFDRVLAQSGTSPPGGTAPAGDPPAASVPDEVESTLTTYLDAVRMMAQVVAQLHLATSGERTDLSFAPEPFSVQYQRSLYQSLRNRLQRTMRDLHLAEGSLPEAQQSLARTILSQEERIQRLFHRLVGRTLAAWRVRIHGDCHLGHFIRAGRNFVLTDFDSPSQPVGERRSKRSPLRDVARMLHSFGFAALAALHGVSGRRGQAVGLVRPEDLERLRTWTGYWRKAVERTFTDAYRVATADNNLLALNDEDFRLLIESLLLERSLAEVSHTLVDSPIGVPLALDGLQRLLEGLPDS